MTLSCGCEGVFRGDEQSFLVVWRNVRSVGEGDVRTKLPWWHCEDLMGLWDCLDLFCCSHKHLHPVQREMSDRGTKLPTPCTRLYTYQREMSDRGTKLPCWWHRIFDGILGPVYIVFAVEVVIFLQFLVHAVSFRDPMSLAYNFTSAQYLVYLVLELADSVQARKMKLDLTPTQFCNIFPPFSGAH